MSKYAPVPGQIPGTEVELSGVVLHLAPVNLNQVKALTPVIKKFNDIATGGDLGEQMEAAMPVIFAAAKRNHPDITEDDLRELVDVGNFQRALEAAMSVGGFKKGEAKAGTTSTGTTSSPASSSPPAGPGSTAASS